MAIALSVTNVIGARRRTTRNFKLTFSGDYTTGGDTVDFTAATNPNNLPAALAFARLPDSAIVQNLPDGYLGEVVPGSGLSNYLLKIYTAEGTELGAAAYPAALAGAAAVQLDVINGVNV